MTVPLEVSFPTFHFKYSYFIEQFLEFHAIQALLESQQSIQASDALLKTLKLHSSVAVLIVTFSR